MIAKVVFALVGTILPRLMSGNHRCVSRHDCGTRMSQDWTVKLNVEDPKASQLIRYGNTRTLGSR